MELNAFSIRERTEIGKEKYKLQDLKKVESLIEAAADKGAEGVEIRYADVENFYGHHKFIADDLTAREFKVTEGRWHDIVENLWISWAR